MKQKHHLSESQLTLPFGQAKRMAISYEDRTRAFWLLSSVCVLSLVAYVYAVNATARNVAHRVALEKEVVALSSELAVLEFEYIALRSGVTIEVAEGLGFKEVKEPLYVSSTDTSLSFNVQNR